MDKLPRNVLYKIFLQIPSVERETLRNVSTHWRLVIDENIGIAVVIHSTTSKSGRLPLGTNWDISTISISECTIESLEEEYRLPEFKQPNLLKKITLKGKITSQNLNNSINFACLKILKFSVETLRALKISDLKLILPELQGLEIFLPVDSTVSKDSAKSLVDNVNSLLEGQQFANLKKINFHFFCFMSGLDSDIRNGVFQFLLNHRETVEFVDVQLILMEDAPDEDEIEDVREAISRQSVQFSEHLHFPALKDFSLIVGNVPLNENDYFGLQSRTWNCLINRVDALECYELNCLDEDWQDRCIFDEDAPYEYIPNKPSMPKDLILRNASSLKTLYLSVRTWDEADEVPKVIDLQVFETCINLEELTLVGQWIRDMTGFIEALDYGLAVTENVDKLPASLKILKSSFILLHPQDVQDLISRNFKELHLKYFGAHGSCHILGGESIAATTFIGKFSQISFLNKAINEAGKFLTRIELIASDCMVREGDDRTTLLDAYLLRNCVHLKDFCLEGMNFEDHYTEFGADSDKNDLIMLQQLVLPLGINRITFFPKSVQRLKLKKVFIKSHHLSYFANELENLKTLEVDNIGQSKNCGVTPKFIREICLKSRIEKLFVKHGLNWTSWNRFDADVGQHACPLLAAITDRLMDENLRLTLQQVEGNYFVKFS